MRGRKPDIPTSEHLARSQDPAAWQDCQRRGGFWIKKDPATIVGVDVAFLWAQMVAATPGRSAIFEGPPVLAVEILSPSDRQETVVAKGRGYLEAGTAAVWVVGPEFQTVKVYRADVVPVGLNLTHEIDTEPHLPGFRGEVRHSLTHGIS